jgi:hypothetical protein
MTPEQIQNAVEAAISQGTLFPWWSFVLFIVLSSLACYFAVYVREKGKNRATTEDIGKITEEIEKVKLMYARESHRFQVACSGLLKKRADAIEELYHLIVDTEEMFGRFVDFAEWKDDPTKDELRKEGGRLLYEFLKKYKQNRIYFSEELCEKLKSYSASIYEVVMPFSIAVTVQNGEGHYRDFTNQWVKSNKDFNTRIPQARKTIEEEFRRLLRVEEM